MDLIREAQSSHEAPRTTIHFGSQYHHGHSLWEERHRHLPKFLHFFVTQNWFKKLFPIFSLEVWGSLGDWETVWGGMGSMGRRQEPARM